MDEIFDIVQRELDEAGFANRLSGGLVMTGGAAAMQGVTELATSVFGTGVRVGMPGENITGLSDSVEAPRFATAVGLTLYGANRLTFASAPSSAKRLSISGPGVDKLTQRVKTWFQDFF
jgi:cell division protein FtsA